MRLAEDKGFTRLPEICAILDRYERPDDGDADEEDIVYFTGLTLDNAIRIMEFLPAWQLDMVQNESPSIREMIQLGDRYPGITFHGYRVPPAREDERISFEGFEIPAEEMPRYEAEDLCERLAPDEFEEGAMWYFWWD